VLKHAATVGLTPQEFYAMTFREFELYAEGHSETWARIWETLAWVQANLINVHVGKGKGVKPQQLLPKGLRRKDVPDAAEDVAPISVADAKARVRAAMRRKADEEWLTSPEGQAYTKRMDALHGTPEE
jgi:hypothetical protein